MRRGGDATPADEADARFTVMLESRLSGEFCGSFRAGFGEIIAVHRCRSDGGVEVNVP